jgi:methyl-accepting chemotaxis protein
MKLSFTLKIGGSFGLILIILLLTGFISFTNMKILQEDAALVTHTRQTLTKIEEVFRDISEAETGARGYIITGDEAFMDPYHLALPEISADMNELKQSISDPGDMQLLVKLESLVEEKLDFLELVINVYRNNGYDAVRDLIISKKGISSMSSIRDIVSEMSESRNQLLEERQLQADRSVKNGKITILLFTAVSFLMVIFLTIFLTYNIALPIRKISGIAEDVSRGNLRIELSGSSRADEVGVLNNAFQNMITNLKTQIGNITEAVNILTSMVAEIIATSSQLTASSTETVTAISETTSTVEEVKQTAQVNNEKAKAVSEGSRKTLQVAGDGEKAVNETGTGMSMIREKMEFIAESIMRLSEQSQAIGDIMNSINDLAEQSNLLAVNASIEAARAGEEGKGFAVVAEEVKSLADQSKQATKQVREILTDIQKATSTAVMATEEGSKVVESGIRQSENAGASIKVLAEVINEAVQATTQIGASVQQQFVGIDQVTEAIRNISVASNQNLESTKQLEEASEKLDGVAKNLEKLVNEYTI